MKPLGDWAIDLWWKRQASGNPLQGKGRGWFFAHDAGGDIPRCSWVPGLGSKALEGLMQGLAVTGAASGMQAEMRRRE